MQLKVSTDYAIRIVLYMAEEQRIQSSRELSDRLNIPQSIVLKITKILCKNSIVEIHMGKNGGFALSKKPADISLLDVIELMETTMKINRCLEKDCFCSRHAAKDCPVRHFYCSMQQQMEQMLKMTTIDDMIKSRRA